MILDALSNCERYYSLNLSFEKAFDFIKNTDLLALPLGKHELDENLFVISEKVMARKKEDAVLEAHKEFIDIQLCISGVDHMGWRALDDCGPIKDDYPDRYLTFYEGEPESLCTVSRGQFAIFFPGDGHAPNIGEGELHKIIFKVRD